ncbi:MAG: polyhydroxybutyrate depolymerase [Pseudomonadota bacterium]
MALPETPEGAPLMLWLHGFASSGRNAINNEAFVADVKERGYALIAPNGQPVFSDTSRLDWGVDDGHLQERDDVAFLREVLTDAVTRFGLDGERILAAGFSRGGSMIWDFACRSPESAAGFAAVAGGFWEPMVPSCEAPVHLHHTHGFTDNLVPLEGRKILFEGRDYAQGNIFKGLEIWREVNGCPGAADVSSTEDDKWDKDWTSCDAGSLTLRLAPIGHGIPEGWTDMVLDWFEGINAQ